MGPARPRHATRRVLRACYYRLAGFRAGAWAALALLLALPLLWSLRGNEYRIKLAGPHAASLSAA